MAAIDDLLQDLANSLREVPEMANAAIVVDRQSNLRKIAAAATAKASGFACFLSDTGGSNEWDKIDKPRINLSLTVELVFKSVVAEGTSGPARDIFEAVLSHMQNLKLTPASHYPKSQFTWKNYRKDRVSGFLIYTLNYDSIVQL